VKYLLDTNAVIGLSKGHPGLEQRMRLEARIDVGLSVIVLHELFFGAYKGRRVAANLDAITDLEFEIVDFSGHDARRSGEIRALLASIGRPIGPFDVLLAGQAVARDLTLVTHNTREFSRVQGLRIEDWEADQAAT
jgi:tRNA(fMet)-specific endonuclease VapC